MRLLIKEYLLMLKESGEIDKLLPELLLAMDFKPLSKAQPGVRQHGVDLAAVRKVKGIETLYLFVIKRGDLGRNDWQGKVNCIRPTLDEIEITYLQSQISPEHANIRKVIVLVTSGDLKQETEIDWKTYKKAKTVKDKLEYEFWGGDQLAMFIEQFMFSEHALPDQEKSKLRKTLALIGESEYDLSHFHDLLESLLFKEPNEKKLLKAFRTINLALNIIFKWAESENNLLNAAKAAERVVLWSWEALRINELLAKKKFQTAHAELLVTYVQIHHSYFFKMHNHLYVQDGLSIYSSDNVLIVESLFEQIGLIAVIGLVQVYLKDIIPAYASLENANTVCLALINLISNNPSSSSPCYDGQSIEVCLALLLMLSTDNQDPAKAWLEKLAHNLTYTYGTSRYFPTANDSFEDLIEYQTEPTDEAKKELKLMSSYTPLLMQWMAVFDMNETYQFLLSHKQSFKNTTLQLWYPEANTEDFIYRGPAHLDSGTAEAPIPFPSDISKLKEHISIVKKSGHFVSIKTFSHAKHGFMILDLIASRHFRTPVSPEYWQDLIQKA